MRSRLPREELLRRRRLYDAAYRARNREALNAKNRAWWARHRERILQERAKRRAVVNGGDEGTR